MIARPRVCATDEEQDVKRWTWAVERKPILGAWIGELLEKRKASNWLAGLQNVKYWVYI